MNGLTLEQVHKLIKELELHRNIAGFQRAAEETGLTLEALIHLLRGNPSLPAQASCEVSP